MITNNFNKCVLFPTILILIAAGCDREPIYVPEEPFWEEASSNKTGTIYSFVSNREGHIFAAADYAGVLRSTDDGLTWKPVNTGLSDTWIKDLVIDSVGTLFACGFNKIFRSDDDGENWVHAYSLDRFMDFNCMAINSAGHIFATGYHPCYYRSTDGGNTWERTAGCSSGVVITCIAASNSGRIFAGGRTLVFPPYNTLVYSDDNGESWSDVEGGFPKSTVHALLINSSEDRIYAGTETGLYVSHDDGENWVPTSDEWVIGPVMSVNLDEHGCLFAGTPDGIYKSTDEGQTWSEVGIGLSDRGIVSLASNRHGEILAGSIFGVIYRLDGGRWKQVNEPGIPGNSNIKDITTTRNGYVFATVLDYTLIGNRMGILRSHDYGRTWTVCASGAGTSIIAKPDGTVLVTSRYSMLRSRDYGESWEELELPVISRCFFANLTMDSEGDCFANSGSCRGIIYSADNGDSWQQIGPENSYVDCFTVDNTGTVFAVTGRSILYKHKNSGDWFRFPDIIIDRHHYPSIRAIVCNHKENVYVAEWFRGYLFSSSVDDSRWNRVGDVRGVEVILVSDEYPGAIFVSTDKGASYSSNNGDTWMDINEGLPTGKISCFTIDEQGYVYAGTRTDGLYRCTKPVYNIISD